jgi:hypothetical protein
MDVELRKPPRSFPATHATIRLALPSHANVPWIPFPGMLNMMLQPPADDAMRLHASVSSMLHITSFANAWDAVARDVPIADVRIATASLVTTGDVICSITAAQPWLITEAVERITCCLSSLSLLWIAADAREGARRTAARLSERDTLAWSETSCVMRTKSPQHEAAAAIVFGQAPSTANGIVAFGSVDGRRILLASSVLDDVGEIESWRDPIVDTVWLAGSERTFSQALDHGGCVPIVPCHRDVTFVMKHASKPAPCGLRAVGQRYGFLAGSSADAQQGFRSLVNVGMCPLEAIAVLDVDAAAPPLIIERASEHPANLHPIADVPQVNVAAAATLMFS